MQQLTGINFIFYFGTVFFVGLASRLTTGDMANQSDESRHYQQPVPHFLDHHSRQCLLYSSLFLDRRAIRSTSTFDLRRHWYARLRVYRCDHWNCHARQHHRGKSPDCIHLYLHLLLCLDLGTGSLGRYR